LAFALSATVKTVVENLIFLFITHPYDVGDRVDIDNEKFTVLKFQIMVTVLKRVDGVTIFSPNSVLSTKSIQNIRRSGPQSENILVPVAFDTPTEKIKLLEDKLNQFLVRESRDFMPKVTIGWRDIVSKSTLLLSVTLDYKSNWQDGPLKTARRNKFLQHLRACLAECEIDIAEPTGVSVDLGLKKDGSQSILSAIGINTSTSTSTGESMGMSVSSSNETLMSAEENGSEERGGLRRRR
jgi:small-conductance mechanosensitive channel